MTSTATATWPGDQQLGDAALVVFVGADAQLGDVELVGEVLEEAGSVDHGDHRVDAGPVEQAELVAGVDDEGGRHRKRLTDAGRLDH